MSKRRRGKRRPAPTQKKPARTARASTAAPARPDRAPRRAPAPARRAPAAAVADAPLSRAALIGAGLVGLVAFVVYLLTLQRSVPTGDSGELITAAYVLGVAHPPGYPLFTLLGHVATWLPFGSPALRVNLLSALWDALAVAIVFLIVYRLVQPADEKWPPLRRDWPALAAAGTAALLLAFSTPFWMYSVVGEVFALNNLFAALLLYVALEWWRRPDRTWLVWVFAFLLGLALTNQQTIVLLVPAFAVLAWSGWSALRRASRAARTPRPLRLRDVGIAAGLFVVGLMPYLYVALAARTDPPVNWGDPQTLDRFVELVSRANYGTLRLTVEGREGSISEQLGLLTSNLARAFVFVGIALAVLGAVWAWRRRRAAGIALAVAFVVAGPVFVAYAKVYIADDLTKGVLERFYILPSVPLAILAGAGAWQVLVWAQGVRRPALRPYLAWAAGAALLAVPVASAAAHYDTADQSDNNVAIHYAEDVLGPLEPNALLLMRSDENFTSIFYAQNAADYRRDVIALDAELLKLPSTVEQLRRQHPDVEIPWDSYDGGGSTSLIDLVEANIPKRPVYYVGVMEEKNFASSFDQVRAGFARRLLPKGQAPDEYEQLRRDSAKFAAYRYPTRSYPSTTWEDVIAQSYGRVAFDLGFALQAGGAASDVPLEERMYRTAIRHSPSTAPAYKNLGLLLRDHGGDRSEIIALWKRFLRLKPNDPDAGRISAELAKLEQKP